MENYWRNLLVLSALSGCFIIASSVFTLLMVLRTGYIGGGRIVYNFQVESIPFTRGLMAQYGPFLGLEVSVAYRFIVIGGITVFAFAVGHYWPFRRGKSYTYLKVAIPTAFLASYLALNLVDTVNDALIYLLYDWPFTWYFVSIFNSLILLVPIGTLLVVSFLSVRKVYHK